jgi:hypothetical protein
MAAGTRERARAGGSVPPYADSPAPGRMVRRVCWQLLGLSGLALLGLLLGLGLTVGRAAAASPLREVISFGALAPAGFGPGSSPLSMSRGGGGGGGGHDGGGEGGGHRGGGGHDGGGGGDGNHGDHGNGGSHHGSDQNDGDHGRGRHDSAASDDSGHRTTRGDAAPGRTTRADTAAPGSTASRDRRGARTRRAVFSPARDTTAGDAPRAAGEAAGHRPTGRPHHPGEPSSAAGRQPPGGSWMHWDRARSEGTRWTPSAAPHGGSPHPSVAPAFRGGSVSRISAHTTGTVRGSLPHPPVSSVLSSALQSAARSALQSVLHLGATVGTAARNILFGPQAPLSRVAEAAGNGPPSRGVEPGGGLAVLLLAVVVPSRALPRQVRTDYLGRLTWIFTLPPVRPG